MRLLTSPTPETFGLKRCRVVRIGKKTKYLERVVIVNNIRGSTQTMSHWKKEHVAELRQTFDIDIDIDALINRAVQAAFFNKSGKGTISHGAVKAKRVKCDVLHEGTLDNPIPAPWKEVQS